MNTSSNIEVGDEILGRVIDAFGNPIDEEGNKISVNESWPLNGKPINPMKRIPISESLDVGIKSHKHFIYSWKRSEIGNNCWFRSWEVNATRDDDKIH